MGEGVFGKGHLVHEAHWLTHLLVPKHGSPGMVNGLHEFRPTQAAVTIARPAAPLSQWGSTVYPRLQLPVAVPYEAKRTWVMTWPRGQVPVQDRDGPL